MTSRLFSIFLILFIGLSSAVFFLFALVVFSVTVLFDRRRVVLHLFSSFWASLYLWCMPLTRVTIEGRANLDWQKHYVIVSNHQSQLDILVAYGLFYPFKWVSKAEVFKLPFIGWNMVLNQYVALKRGDKASIEKMMQECEAALEKGCSLFFFPEGTRSKSGQLKPFKPGAFILAQKTGTPLLPVVIDGTRDVLPKNSLLLNSRNTIRLKVMKEVPVSEFRNLPVQDAADKVRNIIAEELARIRSETDSSPERATAEASL